MLPPSIDSISVPIDSFIVLMESNPITFQFNEKLDSVAFTVSSFAMDTVQFSSILTDDYLQITLEPPFASYDSISIDFPYLEDQSSLTTVDIAYTYQTPILGDYDLDGKISYSFFVFGFLPILFLYSTLLGLIVLGFAVFLGTSSYIFKNIEKNIPTAIPKKSSPNGIPKYVADRMAKRIFFTAGIPTIMGMSVFIVSYICLLYTSDAADE